MCKLNGVSNLEPCLRDESRTSRTEESFEGFFGIANVSALYHRPRNVRAADRTALRLFVDRVHFHLHSKTLKLVDNSLRAKVAIAAELSELRLEQRRTLNVER